MVGGNNALACEAGEHKVCGGEPQVRNETTFEPLRLPCTKSRSLEMPVLRRSTMFIAFRIKRQCAPAERMCFWRWFTFRS